MARRKRQNALDQSHRLAHGAEEQIGTRSHRCESRAGTQPLASSARTSEAKSKCAIDQRVVKRLDAQASRARNTRAGASGTALRHLDDRKGKHAVQMFDAVVRPTLHRRER